jgi:hypothetical protein
MSYLRFPILLEIILPWYLKFRSLEVHSEVFVQVFPPAKTIFCGIGILLAVRVLPRSVSQTL